jgi:hypothetical protein
MKTYVFLYITITILQLLFQSQQDLIFESLLNNYLILLFSMCIITYNNNKLLILSATITSCLFCFSPRKILSLSRRSCLKMDSSYSSESASSLLAESTTSGATSSSCCDHAIEEIDEDR